MDSSSTWRSGDYSGHTLTLVVWHEVLHVTPTGDVAPGFGGYAATIKKIEDDPR